MFGSSYWIASCIITRASPSTCRCFYDEICVCSWRFRPVLLDYDVAFSIVDEGSCEAIPFQWTIFASDDDVPSLNHLSSPRLYHARLGKAGAYMLKWSFLLGYSVWNMEKRVPYLQYCTWNAHNHRVQLRRKGTVYVRSREHDKIWDIVHLEVARRPNWDHYIFGRVILQIGQYLHWNASCMSCHLTHYTNLSLRHLKNNITVHINPFNYTNGIFCLAYLLGLISNIRYCLIP